MKQRKRFDVALSFSGADRTFVSQVADELVKAFGRERVFYDANFEAELARPNLDTYLTTIYAEQSALCAVFLSSSYADKEWCGVEWRVMRDILKKKKDEEIMPFRFDSKEIGGMLSIDGYADISNKSPVEVANLIQQRLKWIGGRREQEDKTSVVNTGPFSGGNRSVLSTPDPIQSQTPIDPPQSKEFDETVRKALVDLLGNSRLSNAVQVLLGSRDELEPTAAADALFEMEPLDAINRWTEVVTELYDKAAPAGGAQRDTWALLESIHFRLLPRLVDVSRLANHRNFPNDSLLFTIASPHDPPNRPIELLFARMNRNRVVQFEQRGQESTRDVAVPCTALDVTDAALLARADPDVESAVEQIGFELMKRFHGAKDIPEQMGSRDWKKLNASLKTGRHGVRGFYMVIPHSNRYADPAVLLKLYTNLPNLPKFLMAEDVGEELPFVCDPVDIDAAIEEFWHLKRLWCGDKDDE